MNKDKRRAIFERLRAERPDPDTELNYSTPFELLVAVVLSAQATDVGVNKATAKLFPVANTPEAMLALGEDGIRGYIQTLGLYNNKAKNLAEACRILVDKHGGEVPEVERVREHVPEPRQRRDAVGRERLREHDADGDVEDEQEDDRGPGGADRQRVRVDEPANATPDAVVD